MKQIVLYLIKIVTAGLTSLFLLSLFTLVYNYTGVHVSNEFGATDYKWEPNQWMTTMQEGFSWFRVDSNGYNNAYPSKGNEIDILLMGSSHMEAVQISSKENVGYRLNELLPELYTYNIGISGHDIYTCISNLTNACAEYKPKSFIVLETSSVLLDEKYMQEVIDGNKVDIPSYDSGFIYYLSKYVPAVKILYKSMSEWKNVGEENKPSKVTIEYDSNYEQTVDSFLEIASNSIRDKNCKLIIFYHPTFAQDNTGLYIDMTDPTAKHVFEQSCKNNDIVFIDMTSDFEKMYVNEHILAHGFVNTAVETGHLNKYGHKIIAESVAEYIEEYTNGSK